MRSAVDLVAILRTTLLQLEQDEELKSHGEVLADLKQSIVRTLAELELARANRRIGAEAATAPAEGEQPAF